MIRRLRRRRAEIRLALVDADVARWYVRDGQLSDDAHLSVYGQKLRDRRVRAVRELERLGGRDPQPTFFKRHTG